MFQPNGAAGSQRSASPHSASPPRKGQDAPTSRLCSCKLPKASAQPEGAGPEPAAPCTWLAGTEELLGHLRQCKAPIRTVTAAPCPAESDLMVQTEKMRRHRPAETSPQTSSHQRWHRHVSPTLYEAGGVVGQPVSPTALGYFPTKEQATCLHLHCTQPFWNSHQSLGVPAHPSLGDVHVTQRHPPDGLIRAGEDERWCCGGSWDHYTQFCVSFWLHYKLTSPLPASPRTALCLSTQHWQLFPAVPPPCLPFLPTFPSHSPSPCKPRALRLIPSAAPTLFLPQDSQQR